MKKSILMFGLSLFAAAGFAKDYRVASPDGKLVMNLKAEKTITYTLNYAGQELLSPSLMGVETADGRNLAQKVKVKKATPSAHKGAITAHFYKKDRVDDTYNQLVLQTGQGFNVIVRVYNEGAAYRFVNTAKKEVTVKNETVELNFPKDFETLGAYVRENGDFTKQFFNSFEATYTPSRLSRLESSRLIFMPMAVKAGQNVKLAITDADVENYPGMYLNHQQGNALRGVFAPYPKRWEQGGHNQLEKIVREAEPYIAKVKAGAALPWRVFTVSERDEQLLENDMVYRLAAPNRVGDVSWVKPGKVAWDWWNDWNLYGVDFRAGINTQTYKYYIDFASKYGIEYVILDEGWAVNLQADLFQIIPEIDLQEIVNYGRQKGVGIILWAGCYAFDRDMERVCKHFSEMGVKGFKIDFMNRDDADMVDFHYRAAATAAKYHLMVDFHGTYKPTGLNRTYPNVVNFEGVDGQEQNKWATMKDYNQVQYDTEVPFLRMLAGQMDYTQGAMLNGTKDSYHPSNSTPMSQGTRCHQLAMYAVFFSPLNMLCDSPSNYERETECTRVIAGIPTTWDKTVGLSSRMGEYVGAAREKDGHWYAGVINNWTARDLTIDLSKTGLAGQSGVQIYRDGPNADRAAQDYLHETISVPADGKVTVHLAPGGGCLIFK